MTGYTFVRSVMPGFLPPLITKDIKDKNVAGDLDCRNPTIKIDNVGYICMGMLGMFPDRYDFVF